MVCSLPVRFGGLGLRSAQRTSPGACWASWADVLPMMASRNPDLAVQIVAQLTDSNTRAACLQAAAEAARTLELQGFQYRASWEDLLGGARPPTTIEDQGAREPGGWAKGLQFHACSATESFHHEQVVPHSLTPTRRALLLSSSGKGASHWLLALPTAPETTMAPEAMQAALRRRIRLQLPITCSRCPGHHCNAPLDPWGDHCLACTRSGNLQRRAKPLERAWQRVFREAGSREVNKPLLRDIIPGIPSQDNKKLDLVARGLPLYGGLPIIGDASLVSPIGSDGLPRLSADARAGAALRDTQRSHQRTYQELLSHGRAKFLVLGAEIGGRWPEDALSIVGQLSHAKAESAPHLLHASARHAWFHRWFCLLSVATMTTVAEPILHPASPHRTEMNGSAPDLHEVLVAVREPPAVSRMPLH